MLKRHFPTQFIRPIVRISSLSCHLLLCWASLGLTVTQASDNSTDDISSSSSSIARSAEEEDETAKPESLPPEYEEEYNSFSTGFNKSGVARPPPVTYKEGPLPTITDSVFSLIILIYVSVIFIFMFFSFCWKEPEPPPPDPAHKNIPMITSMLEEMEKQMAETKKKEEGGMNGGTRNGNGGKFDDDADEGTEMTEIVERRKLSNGEFDVDVVVNVVTEKSKTTTSTIKEETEEEEAATQV